jgi:beta-glucosidase
MTRWPNDMQVFPPGFLWGAGTAAYQIEGAVADDGRGESIWDRFAATPGAVRNGDTGAVACDFYHRYPEDIALMQELGLRAFRFSIAWPRVVPTGHGAVDQRGLDFYDRLVDTLLEAGIEPLVTLYHWDLPQPLEDAGGWPQRVTAERFAEYTEAVVGRLGDRVPTWLTQNEPWVIAWLGYGLGVHAPGRCSAKDALAATHHVLLAHGLALEVLRRDAPTARVGITLDHEPVYPASDDPADLAAAHAFDGERNRLYLDPVLRGAYPEDVLAHLDDGALPVRAGDLELIGRPLDYLGVNYYQPRTIAADGERWRFLPGGHPVTDMGWEVAPSALRDLLVRIHRDYAPPEIVVTENGAAYDDVLDHQGEIRDEERERYVAGHVRAIGEALAAGVPVTGYFVWSLLDNFEWAYGYTKRFGLVYVDYATLERIPKQSFRGYQRFLAAVPGPQRVL